MNAIQTISAITTAACISLAGASEAYRIEPVQFDSHGAKLAGHLYIPAQHQATEPRPAVIVTGAWTTIKEQMAGRYAAEMAKRGVIALAFDFRSWGASDGATRSLEHPQQKTADILAAANFLQTRKDVQSVHGLGICASAGYMAAAGGGTSPLTSIALVAPWLHDQSIVEAVYGGKDGVTALIQKGRAAAAAEASSGKAQLITAAGPAGSGALMEVEGYYVDPKRGLIEAWENTFNLASWEPWLTFDAITTAQHIRIPTTIVHSESAAIPQGAKAFFAKLPARKQQHWLTDISQFDFYDQDKAVQHATDLVLNHISQALALADATTSAHAQVVDHAAVTSIVEQVAVYADAHKFRELELLFAKQVTVDYRTLSGQDPEMMRPQSLMQNWARLLPGFDRTRHALTDIAVRTNAGVAEATASVNADHWLGTAHWRVTGSYRYELSRQAQGWVISSIRFTLDQEFGNRAILAQAMDAAAHKIIPYLQRQHTRQAVLNFLQGLERKDMQTVNAVWADDAVQEMPYAPASFPKRVAGKAALVAHYAGWPDNAGTADFTSALVFHDTQDPHTVIAEFKGTCEIVSTGRRYDQRYIGLFTATKQKITLFREYFNPIPFTYAFKLDAKSDTTKP